MKFTLYGSIVNGEKRYDNPALAEYARKQIEGKRNNRFVEVLERLVARRTDAQNRWLWAGVYTPIHAALYALGNDHLSIEDVHEMMLDKFAPRIEVVDTRTGDIIYGKIIRSSMMNKMQFSEYCDSIVRWAAQFLGINIITPQEYLMQKAA
jgi:hypothetical protein